MTSLHVQVTHPPRTYIDWLGVYYQNQKKFSSLTIPDHTPFKEQIEKMLSLANEDLKDFRQQIDAYFYRPSLYRESIVLNLFVEKFRVRLVSFNHLTSFDTQDPNAVQMQKDLTHYMLSTEIFNREMNKVE